MNYDKDKILSYIKSNKKKIFIILVVLVLLFFYFVFANKKTQNTFIPVATPTTSPSITTVSQNDLIQEGQAYFMNQIVTNYKPVTGFSWKGNKVIYSTKDGIYEGGTNNVVVDKKIDDIRWTNSFNALVKTDNKWGRLNYSTKALEEIPAVLNNPKTSEAGNLIADINKITLTVYNSQNFTSKELKFREPVINVFFVKKTNEIIVQTNFAAKTYLYKTDESLNITKSYETGDDYILSSVSFDGNLASLTLKNKLIVTDFESIKSETIFLGGSTINASFRNSNEIIVVEKYKDNLGRILDNVYVTNSSGKKTKISDSNQLIKRINTSLDVSFNEDKYLATFVENEGRIWILALRPNLFPTYSTEGELVYSNIKPSSH